MEDILLESPSNFLYESSDNRLEFYDYLCKINDIIEDRYPDLIIEIINIDIDNTFENYKNIINLNMKYNLPISDNSETHKPKFYDPYRNTITNIIKEWLEE